MNFTTCGRGISSDQASSMSVTRSATEYFKNTRSLSVTFWYVTAWPDIDA